MCGRYALYGPTSRLRKQFEARIDELPPGFGPRYNAAPMQTLPLSDNGQTASEWRTCSARA